MAVLLAALLSTALLAAREGEAWRDLRTALRELAARSPEHRRVVELLRDGLAARQRQRGMERKQGEAGALDDPSSGPGARGVDRVVDLRRWDPFRVTSGARLERTAWVNGGWTGMHHPQSEGPLDGLVVRDVVLAQHFKWASRMYRVRSEILLEHVTVRHVVAEHGIYWNLAGYAGEIPLERPAITIRDSLFEDIGSQAIQLVSPWLSPPRQQETPQPERDATPGGPILIERCIFRNVGKIPGGDRPAFALSFFASQNELLLRDVEIDNSMQLLSTGALLVQRRPRLVIERMRAVYGRTDRPLAKITGVADVTITGSHFRASGGQPWIELVDCPKVTIEGCTGNVRVSIDGADAGSIDQAITRGR